LFHPPESLTPLYYLVEIIITRTLQNHAHSLTVRVIGFHSGSGWASTFCCNQEWDRVVSLHPR
jgi:hypothetical protein